MVYLWIGLCVAAAMACAVIRVQRPEMATAVSLAAGATVMAMLAAHVESMWPELSGAARAFSGVDGEIRGALLRASGITVISEMAVQLCRDAGESALAGRIALVARVSVLALCAPLVSGILELLGRFSS